MIQFQWIPLCHLSIQLLRWPCKNVRRNHQKRSQVAVLASSCLQSQPSECSACQLWKLAHGSVEDPSGWIGRGSSKSSMANGIQPGKHHDLDKIDGYPLVNIKKTMENHHVQWVNPLFLWSFSIAMLNYQRLTTKRMRIMSDRLGAIHLVYRAALKVSWRMHIEVPTHFLNRASGRIVVGHFLSPESPAQVSQLTRVWAWKPRDTANPSNEENAVPKINMKRSNPMEDGEATFASSGYPVADFCVICSPGWWPSFKSPNLCCTHLMMILKDRFEGQNLQKTPRWLINGTIFFYIHQIRSAFSDLVPPWYPKLENPCWMDLKAHQQTEQILHFATNPTMVTPPKNMPLQDWLSMFFEFQNFGKFKLSKTPRRSSSSKHLRVPSSPSLLPRLTKLSSRRAGGATELTKETGRKFQAATARPQWMDEWMPTSWASGASQVDIFALPLSPYNIYIYVYIYT